MESKIDGFIRYLAVERGLSDNYQLSTRRSLTEFADWCRRQEIATIAEVKISHLTAYLGERKRSGLAASSIKLVVVALKIFFRFLVTRGQLQRDVTETLSLPRIESFLPET